MKRFSLFFFCVLLVLLPCLVIGSQPTTFTYDESGNRTSRNTIRLSTFDEENVSVMSAMEMPENNEVLEHFYTDRLNESDVIIFPNPTRGALAVEILNMNPDVAHQITVLSVRGLVVFQKNNITNFTEIDLSAQPRGVYLLRISAQDRFITWKIIKE